jgi:hypothetical protein
MLKNVVGYWAYIRGTYIWGAYIRLGLHSGGGAYIWNEVSVSICGGLIFGGLIFGGGLIVGGLRYNMTIDTSIPIATRHSVCPIWESGVLKP